MICNMKIIQAIVYMLLEENLQTWGKVINSLTLSDAYMHQWLNDPDNGLSPGQWQAITWTNAEILFTGCLGRNFSEISIKIHISSFKKMLLKMSSGQWYPFFPGLNVLISPILLADDRRHNGALCQMSTHDSWLNPRDSTYAPISLEKVTNVLLYMRIYEK